MSDPTLTFGDGDYSCAVCGLGMRKPCEHWREMLLWEPTPPGEARLSAMLYRSLERISLSIEGCAKIGFQESKPTTNERHAQVWNDLNDAQADAKLKLKHYAQFVSGAPTPPADPPSEIRDALNRALEEQRLEIQRLKRELAASGNYMADDAVFPTSVTFNNGRTVSIVARSDGRGHQLHIGRLTSQTQPSEAALESRGSQAPEATPSDAAMDLIDRLQEIGVVFGTRDRLEESRKTIETALEAKTREK